MTEGLRHEYKYLISAADARLLKIRLKHIMEFQSFLFIRAGLKAKALKVVRKT